jgi:cytoskeletal protein RodZ
MVRRKIRSKSKAKSIKLKRRSKRSSYKNNKNSLHSFNRDIDRFLDKTVSVRNLLKYSCLTLAFIIVFLSVFMLGRFSVSSSEPDNPAQSSQLSGQTTQTIKSNPDPDNSNTAEVEEEPEEEIEEPTITSIDMLEANNGEEEEENQEEVYEEEEEPEEEIEEPSCKNKVAGFDYSYTKVPISVSNFNKETKGDNWASLTSLKLTVTNNEPCTIINPTRIKIKLNAKGKGSVWWDDDVFLPDSFRHMLPGTTVSEIIPIHVSYSDIYSEKDFRLTLFDDYDISIGTFKEYITFHGSPD